MPRIFQGVDDFRGAAGESLGTGPWMEISQDRIDSFADVTEDWQWIHIDPERATASEIGATIAHGYLTLSLVPKLSSQIFDFANIGRALNYGLDKVASRPWSTRATASGQAGVCARGADARPAAEAS